MENDNKKIMSIVQEDGSIDEVEVVIAFEFKDTKKEYVVYTRIPGIDGFEKSDSTISLKSEDPAYGAIIDAPNKNLTGTVTEDKGRSVLKVPMNTVVRTYGDWKGLDGSGDIICDKFQPENENGFDFAWEE